MRTCSIPGETKAASSRRHKGSHRSAIARCDACCATGPESLSLQRNDWVPPAKPVPTRTPDFGFNWLKR
ncbi:hypothetical protein ACM43_08815 [Bradyrhizobium sp. CCBAU 45321]|nr:hypothetical protein [Bradyrhizobium sp. CCBAU 45321]